jgi:arylsulfatase A-like enzyme
MVTSFPLNAVAQPQSAPAKSELVVNQPNILWIFSEDLSPFMGCYDDPINTGHTPAIDAMAAQGVIFKRVYMPAPVCSACRSAIITGVMQTTTGTHQHRSGRTTDGEVVPADTRIHLPQGIASIPELMRNAGYFTFNSGKDDYNFDYDRRALYDVGTADNYLPGMNGWQGNKARHALSFTKDTWRARENKSQPWFGQIEIKGGKANAKHVRDGELLKPTDVPLPPYFPNTPAHRDSWTTHYNAARGADAQVEQIISQLKSDGELENTIVFFFSDHGSNHSLRHKQFCYEGGVHVPLVVMGNHPALKPGTVRTELISGLDISAATLALGGVDLPDYLDGQDLFAADYQNRDHVISARDRCDYTIDRIRTVRSDKLRYIRNYFPERAMLQAQYRDGKKEVLDLKRLHAEGKLTEYQDQHWFGVRPVEELYDLAADPHQVNNLADKLEFAAELRRHREILETWIKQTDDQGQYPESAGQLKATYDLWKNKPIFSNADVNPEYDSFRETTKPNVVLFLVDDFGWGALSCMGSPFHETPNIDALYKSSMVFPNGYAACTVCSPSRAAILTGCYPGRTHLTDWIVGHKKPFAELAVPDWKMKIDHDRITLAEALQEQGYATEFIGKWHLMPIEQPELMNDHYPQSHGFDVNIGGREWGQPKGPGKYFYPWDMPNVEGGKEGDFLTDRLTDYAVEFIEQPRANPFFLYFSYYTVHGPIMGKPELVQKYEAKKKTGDFKLYDSAYAAMVQSLDESVGRVLNKLEKTGQADNTIVLFTADNGANKNIYCGGLRDFKGFSHEGGTREPFFIKGAGIAPGSCDVPVIGMDLYPTLLDLIDAPLKPDQHLDGVSLEPLLKQSGTIPKRSLFWHYPHYHRTLPYGAIRNGNWKLIEFFEDGALELYNLASDPHEENNLSKSSPEKASQLLDELKAWRTEVGAQMPTPNPNYDPTRTEDRGVKKKPSKYKRADNG